VTSPHYIAFEGAEACGKSTQAALLATRMDAVLTRETGGTAVGARLRAILHDNSVMNLTPRAEALMTAADRAQHLAEVVGPALDGGRSVVSDRSLYSTLAYQGYGRELDVEELTIINDWAINACWPETVIFLDTPDELIAERLQERELDRFEAAGEAFHQRVIEGFRTMASGNTERWITVDSRGSIDEVEASIVAALTERGVL
jgi:dTMP kinase|tara:strand:+ start:69 stop:677 length:609 start_codon:yes stop_codon:yes gene_type:complete